MKNDTHGAPRAAPSFMMPPQFKKAEDNSREEESHSESWAISDLNLFSVQEPASSSPADGPGPLMHVVCSCQQQEMGNSFLDIGRATVPH